MDKASRATEMKTQLTAKEKIKTKTNGLKADCSHPVALETVFFCNADSKRICQPIEDALGSRKLGYAKQEVVTSAC